MHQKFCREGLSIHAPTFILLCCFSIYLAVESFFGELGGLSIRGI
jgi:hypothetical protein